MKVEFFKLIETGACGVFRCPVRLPESALELADQAEWRTVPVDLLAARDNLSLVALIRTNPALIE